MGKASSSKKVARAAGIGGGRTSRGKAPVLWYSTLVVILAAGIGLTAFSRDQRRAELASPESKVPPRPNVDHWHVALGVRVCDRWLDPVLDDNDPKGIHTHGDGIIHVHPFQRSSAGSRATFERYAEAVGGELAATRFSWPEGAAKKKVERGNGDKCGEQEGEVKAFYNGEVHEGDPSDILLTDRGKLVLAFVPKGTTYDQIGDPPTTGNLDNLDDVDPPKQPQTQTPASPGAEPGATVTQDPTVSPQPGAPAPSVAPETTAPAGAPQPSPPSSVQG